MKVKDPTLFVNTTAFLAMPDGSIMPLPGNFRAHLTVNESSVLLDYDGETVEGMKDDMQELIQKTIAEAGKSHGNWVTTAVNHIRKTHAAKNGGG